MFFRMVDYDFQNHGLVAELVDAADLKSVDRKVVRVRVPPCPFLHAGGIG